MKICSATFQSLGSLVRRTPLIHRQASRVRTKYFSSNTTTSREKLFYDVVTVGGGPAGLATAIRLKQLAISSGQDISVCVLEKGAEIGAHVLSGNVFETKALDELFPDWRSLDCPISTKAASDNFLWLTENGSISIPHALLPSQLDNTGNYIISLSQLTKWLSQKAEELGVEIYPGFAASEVLYNESGAVCGVATRDAGVSKDGTRKSTFTPGIEIISSQTVFAEGCRGSCSEEIISKFELRKNKNEQTYGLGIKEVWEIPSEKHKPGLIQHTLGWPLQQSPISNTFGGTFLYHMEPNLVLLGMVVGLSYQNTFLSPYKEFQRWKHHPEIAKHIEGGNCVAYGARCLNEGGYHSIPKLTFPGGLMVGCSAGFLNGVKIKGSHTAIKSGMLAAESIYPKLIQNSLVSSGGNPTQSLEIPEYEAALYSSWVGKELYQVRNAHASFSSPLGTLGGMAYTAFSCFISRGNEPWTFSNDKSDASKTKLAKDCKPIEYPKPDGKLSFDLLTNLQRSGTNHDHDQPIHLRVKDELKHIPSEISITQYDGPEQRFCPAGVYEYSDADSSGKRSLIINAQNCVHCKCCSIKTPHQFIKWTVPEGGGGPAYNIM